MKMKNKERLKLANVMVNILILLIIQHNQYNVYQNVHNILKVIFVLINVLENMHI